MNRVHHYALLTVAVAAIGASWFWKRQTAAARTELVRLEEQTRALAAKAADIRAALPDAGSMGAVSPADTRSEAATGSAPAASGLGDLHLMRTDAAVQARMLADQRAQNDLEYAALFSQLKLTPKQIAQFGDNLVRYQAAQSDLRAAEIAQHLLSSDAAAQKLFNQAQGDYYAAQKSVVGAPALDSVKNYDDQTFARNVASDIVGAGVMDGIVFTPAQTQQLAAAIAASERDDGVTDRHAVDQKSRAFLSAEQADYAQSSEALGPFGYGGKFQNALNDLINQGDADDVKKGISKPNG